MADYEIREYRAGDLPSLLETFELCFARPGADRPARTAAEWSYTYEQNPAGWRIWVAATEGKVVAQYAARPYRVWLDGHVRSFAEIVDSMVHPDHRMGLKAPGLFVQTARPFFDAYGGPNHPKDMVHYGWPIEAAYRIGKLFLGYSVLRSQTALAREPGPGGVELPQGVEVLERFDASVDPLYERCKNGWGASTIRDAAFLNWRFVDHPQHDYTLFAVRAGDGALRGYAVYRTGDWILPHMGLVADFLVPTDEDEVARALTEALLARARADRVSTIGLFLPEWSSWFERFQDWGFLVWPTPYNMIVRAFDPKYSLFWLRDHWWFTLADSDLV